ncbi:3667_t:CDS:2 [Ambispora leptoticha]|uniref:3667_t:CDS:1 n=1 Tax=Ambispora leptoticha TaxID=144679 RepID=A0A9N9GIW7_9GLOM|nr:3667_t:CDS:2 [Ambispora leptoticha]
MSDVHIIEANDKNNLIEAIKNRKATRVQSIIDNCIQNYDPESMLIVVEALPLLAVQYPKILSYFLKKCHYIESPPGLTDCLDTSIIKRRSLLDNTKIKTYDVKRNKNSYLTTKCYIPLPGLFTRKNGCSPFDKLAYLHSIEAFQSPVFEAIVMQKLRVYSDMHSAILVYYIIHFSLFVAVISNTNNTDTRNESLMISSLFFGSFTILSIGIRAIVKLIKFLSYSKDEMPLRVYFFKTWDTFVGLAASFLPVATVSLEYRNHTASPELKSLSILFMWIFLVLQLRLIKGVGIFLSVIQTILTKIKWLLLFLIFVLFAFAHSFMVLLSETLPDNGKNTFTSFAQSFKNVWLMLLNDYTSLLPWTSNHLLDFLVMAFSFSTTIVTLNILIALMNNAYEETYKNANTVWIIRLAEFIVDLEYSYNPSRLDRFEDLQPKEPSYIVYTALKSNKIVKRPVIKVEDTTKLKDEKIKEFRETHFAEPQKFPMDEIVVDRS